MLIEEMVFLLTGLYVSTFLGSSVKLYEGLNKDVLRMYMMSVSAPSTSDSLIKSQ